MRNHFIFGGHDSVAFGVYISGSGVFNAPKRSYSTFVIPGRNGELTMDNHRYENIELTYPAFAHENFRESIAGLKAALLTASGYQRLEDSYYPEEYRRALFTGDLKIKPTKRLDAGEFDIKFNCDPRRFLKSGDITQTIANNGKIENPTAFDAKPLIRVTGYGEVYVGSYRITVSSLFPYVDIDCEMIDCYHDTDNANPVVTFEGNDFPVLPPGRTGVTYSGHVTKVEITPHWWRL